MTTYRKLAAVLFAGSLVLAACGDDDDDAPATATARGDRPPTRLRRHRGAAAPRLRRHRGAERRRLRDRGHGEAPAGTEAPAEDSGMAAAQANVDQYSEPDGTIGVTIPLTGVPEPKTIAWLECDVPTCAAYLTPGFQAATEAIGWELEIIPMKSTDPGPAFQQAIDDGVDYIASTGLATAQYQAQLDAANEAGIGVLSCFGTDDPSPDTIQMQCGDENFVEKTGPLMADWGIVDSGGAMNVLIVSIPDFPVLKVETDAFIAQLETNCPDCTYEELNVTLDDLIGGQRAGLGGVEGAGQLRPELRLLLVRRPARRRHLRAPDSRSRRPGQAVRPGLLDDRPRRRSSTARWVPGRPTPRATRRG